MPELLPILHEEQITIDPETAIATASFQFADGSRMPAHIGWVTLREWAIHSQSFEIKSTILEHCALLTELVMRARASGETFISLL
jgi:hypothetical protein